MTLNPFTLKELRQLTRSKMIAGSLVGFLFACLAIAYSVPVLSGGITQTTGGDVFGFLNFLLTVVCGVVIPWNVFSRLDRERGGGKKSMEFTLLTSLSPKEIVDGKLRGAFALIVLFTAAALPFGVFSYLLHGISLGGIGKMLLATFAGSMLSVHVALCAGSLRIGHRMRVFTYLAILLFWGVFLLPSGIFASGMADEGMPLGTLYFVAVIVTLCFILRGFAISTLSPLVMERDCPFRVALIVSFLAWGVYVVTLAFSGDFYIRRYLGYVSVYVTAFAVLAIFLALHASAQPEGYSRRMLAERPSSRWRRIVAWPFGSRAINGLFFASALAIVISAIMPLVKLWADRYYPSQCHVCTGGEVENTAHSYICAIVLMYAISVILLVRLAWKLASRRVTLSPALVPIAAVAIFLFLQSVPSLRALDNPADWSEYASMPFCVLGAKYHPLLHLAYSSAAFSLAWILYALARGGRGNG